MRTGSTDLKMVLGRGPAKYPVVSRVDVAEALDAFFQRQVVIVVVNCIKEAYNRTAKRFGGDAFSDHVGDI